RLWRRATHLDLHPDVLYSSRRRHTSFSRDWSSDVCSSDLQITIIYEAHTQLRRVYLSGPHAQVADSDLFPTRNGYSTGHWEGDRSEERRVGIGCRGGGSLRPSARTGLSVS